VNPPPQPDGLLKVCVTSRSLDPNGTCVNIPPSSGGAPAPEVFKCHGTATVGLLNPNFRDNGVTGQVQGTGTCQSSSGTWQATLSGLFGAGLGEQCPAGFYQFTPLQLTNGASTFAPDQFWNAGPVSGDLALLSGFGFPIPLENAGDSQAMVVTSTANGLGVGNPAGAGRIQGSPQSCDYQAPFQVTADWVFTGTP
jgi:hypothetical protein